VSHSDLRRNNSLDGAAILRDYATMLNVRALFVQSLNATFAKVKAGGGVG